MNLQKRRNRAQRMGHAEETVWVVPEEAGPRDSALVYGLLVLVWLSTLLLASKRVMAMAALVYASVALTLWAAWVWRDHATLAAQRLHRVRWPLGAMVALTAWMALQATPLPQDWVQALSPEAWAVQHGVVNNYALSLDTSQTKVHAALSLALTLVFGLVVLLMRDRQRLDRLVMGLVLIGLFQALLGLLLWSVKAKYLMLHFEVLHDQVKGTFGNRNHMANYLMLTLSMGIGLMVARLGSGGNHHGRHWRGRLQSALDFLLSNKMRLRLILVILVIALVLTRSRMGNTAFFAGLLIVGLLALLMARKSAPSMAALILSLVVVDVLVVGTWVGLEKVLERIQETELRMEEPAPPMPAANQAGRPAADPASPTGPFSPSATLSGTQTGALPAKPVSVSKRREESVEQRQIPARYALDLIQDFGWVGTGAGSFYGAFLRYRPPGDGFVDHAHNDYAETAANLGWTGLALKALLVLLSVGVCVRTLLRRQSHMARGVAFGVLMATVGMAIHATVDFSLQIPANALLMVVILALGWSAAMLPTAGRQTLGEPAGF